MKNTEILHVEQYLAYKDFLKECQNKIYDESLVLHKHHIIPKCLGGNNSKANLIKLSVEDHVNAHLMLSECFDIDSYEYVSNLRSARVLNRKSIRDKETLKKISDTFIGKNNPFYGKYHTQENINKTIERNKKRKGMTYDEIYGDDANAEKQKRSDATSKQWANRTQEERDALIDKVKISNLGREPWNKDIGKVAYVDGIKFETLKKAMEHFNMNRVLLLKTHDVIIEEKK